MLREELSEEKRKDYDALTAKMMREIEEELAKLPEIRRILGTVKK